MVSSPSEPKMSHVAVRSPLFPNRCPQWGHLRASVETGLPHSLHFMRAMISSPNLVSLPWPAPHHDTRVPVRTRPAVPGQPLGWPEGSVGQTGWWRQDRFRSWGLRNAVAQTEAISCISCVRRPNRPSVGSKDGAGLVQWSGCEQNDSEEPLHLALPLPRRLAAHRLLRDAMLAPGAVGAHDLCEAWHAFRALVAVPLGAL